MSNTSMILSSLMVMSLVIMIAPNVITMNHGKILRNTALWLAIFLGLALIYKNFGPDSDQPLFSAANMTFKHNDSSVKNEPALKADEDKNEDQSSVVDHGYTPPKE